MAADPASSHFSCWRRIPDERRKLSAWLAIEASQQATSTGKNRSWTTFHHPAAGSLPLSSSRFPPESTWVR